MKKLLPLLCGALLLLAACRRDAAITDTTLTFPTGTWNHFQPEQLDVRVDNVEDYYDNDLTVSVDTARYRYSEFPVRFELTSPAGESRQFYSKVTLKENGRWRGEAEGGLRTVKGRVRSYFSFNHAGTHSLSLYQTTGQFDLEGIHSLRLQITRATVDYNL